MSGRKRVRILTLNDPHSLRVNRELSVEIGFQESIVFLQLEFLISISELEREGRTWTRQSLQELRENHFPYWSAATIGRILERLEAAGLIDSRNHNRAKYDRTRWFAINVDGVAKLESVAISQNEKSNVADCEIEDDKMRNPLPQDETPIKQTTEETLIKTTESSRATPDDTTTKCLQLLLQVKDFPRDQGQNALSLAKYRYEFSTVDPEEVCRDFAANISEKPFRKGDKPRLRLRNFFKQAAKYRKPSKAPPPEAPAINGKVAEDRRKEGYEWLFGETG